MDGFVSFRYSSASIGDKTLGALASAEGELIRADAAISCSPLKTAIRQQLLRIEALASASIDGLKVDYRTLLMLETAINNAALLSDNCERVFHLANKLKLNDASGAVTAYRYMRTIDWVSRNVERKTVFSPDVFEFIRDLYNEEQIAKLALGDDVPCITNAIDAQNRSTAPAEKNMPTLHDDLREEIRSNYIAFINDDVLTPSAQAEVSHALLQLIKPYEGNLDGYERVFTHMVFYRRGLLTHAIAPLAVGVSVDVSQHVKTLTTNMTLLSTKKKSMLESYADFEHSAFCTRIAAKTACLCTKALETYWTKWRHALAAERSSTTVGLLLQAFLESSYLTVDFASRKISKSFSSTNNAMQILVKAGIVNEVGHFAKHRVFCAPELINFFGELAQKLTSSSGPSRNELLAEFEKSLD